ncbi:DedA family protein [Paenibacillus yanchengensis]|uniref:DedA family protein n=1 Tax=Paenibacillus yanchengensis TaxID=2035833 RepID=A0ABW4YIC7_9BACL
MEQWVTQMIEQYGYAGILLLIAIENIFPPIPSEVILLLGGFMTTRTSLSVFGVVIVATLGSLIGATILYGVGRIVNLQKLERFVETKGSWMRIDGQDIVKANRWFDKYGYWAILVCRIIPLVRSLISLPAGMAKMRMPTFLLYTMVGTFIWNIVLVSLGAFVGERWTELLDFMSVYSTIIYIVLGLVAAAFLVYILRRRASKR